MRYNQKRTRKSSKKAQLWIFTPHFSKLSRAFTTLQPPKQHLFLDFLGESRRFISQQGHDLQLPHAKGGQKEPCGIQKMLLKKAATKNKFRKPVKKTSKETWMSKT